MKYLIGAIVGIVWGCLVAWVNSRITRKALASGKDQKLMEANLARTGIDVAALAAIFLLRNVLPFSFEAAIIGTAVGMSILTIVLSFRIAAGK